MNLTIREQEEVIFKEWLDKYPSAVKDGGANSNMKEVDTIALENTQLLQRQVSIYNPKIIVCCGVGNDLFDNIFKDIAWKQTTRGIWYLQNDETISVAYYHPNAHIKSNFLYYV